MSEYYKIVSQLPLPTREQTHAFMEHVVRAHSWYKHLPLLPPGTPFAFYLDPNAGRQVCKKWTRADHPGGPFPEWFAETKPRMELVELAAALVPVFDSFPMKTVIKDITDRKQCWHYSFQLTTEYRSKFGYWHYWHGPGPIIYSIEEVELGPGSLRRIQAPMPLPVPEEIVRQCSCPVTALICGYAKCRGSMRHWRNRLAEFDRYVEEGPDSPHIQRCKGIREALNEMVDFSLQPDARCDVHFPPACDRIRGWTYRVFSLKDLEAAQIDPHQSYLASLAIEEQAFQRDQMLNTLLRARDYFATICKGGSAEPA